MNQRQFEGVAGVDRLKAHMRVLYTERKDGTGVGWGEDFFRGVLHGMSLVDAIAADVSLPVHAFINERAYERP